MRPTDDYDLRGQTRRHPRSRSAEQRAEPPQRLGDLRLADHERRQEAQRARAGGVEDERAARRARAARAPARRRRPRPPPSARAPRTSLHARQLAQRPRPAASPRLAHRARASAGSSMHVERGVGGGATPAGCRRRSSRGRRARRRRRAPARDQRADRQPAAEALGQRHHVGPDAVALVGPQRAGAPHPGLDLVEDQQRAVLVAGRADLAPPARPVERVHARLALDRARAPRPRSRPSTAAGAAAGSTASKPGTSGANGACLVSCGVADSAPNVRPWKPPCSTTKRPPGRRLRASLSAASLASAPELAEEHLAAQRALRQPLGQPHHRRGVEEVRDVQQPRRLLLHRGDDLRMAVAGVADRDPAQEVEVLVARRRPTARTPSPRSNSTS